MIYSIDSSCLINGYRKHYPFKRFPSFWENLDALISSGDLVASEVVFDELAPQDDEVFKWVQERENMFIPIDEQLENSVETIVNGFNLYDRRTNRSGADPYVVALAANHELIVLSEEENSKSTKYVNIPDVCESLNLECMNLLGLIDREDWVF